MREFLQGRLYFLGKELEAAIGVLPRHVRQQQQRISAHGVPSEVMLREPDRVMAQRFRLIGKGEFIAVQLCICPRPSGILQCYKYTRLESGIFLSAVLFSRGVLLGILHPWLRL